jgi:hypothetical protein
MDFNGDVSHAVQTTLFPRLRDLAGPAARAGAEILQVSGDCLLVAHFRQRILVGVNERLAIDEQVGRLLVFQRIA